MEMFRVWGYRLDALSLRYLAHPAESIASIGGSPVTKLGLILLGLFVSMALSFDRLVKHFLREWPPTSLIRSISVLIPSAAALVIAERGGLDWRIPIGRTSGYFSTDIFANRTTGNALWSLASTLRSIDAEAPQIAMDSSVAASIVDSLLTRYPHDSQRRAAPQLLRYKPRYLILIIWESLNSKLLAARQANKPLLSGLEGFARNGILFSRLYAAGPRTTNGLVATLGGLPSHPVANALRSFQRSARIPSLARTLSRLGYRASVHYGASLTFDNRVRYFMTGGYDAIIEKKDFPPGMRQSPWGVHDPITLTRLLNDLDTAQVPVFAVTLTLSSHEPFSVPGVATVKGGDPESRFLNAQAYTDRAVTEFLVGLERRGIWDSSLVVIVGDHGSIYPTGRPAFSGAPSEFNIPMVWLGGALAVRDSVIDAIGSQFDIPALIMDQLQIRDSTFRWANDFLRPGAVQFAFYSFPNAFGFVDKSGEYVFDNASKRVVYESGRVSRGSVVAGRAFQQAVTQAYVQMAAPAANSVRSNGAIRPGQR